MLSKDLCELNELSAHLLSVSVLFLIRVQINVQIVLLANHSKIFVIWIGLDVPKKMVPIFPISMLTLSAIFRIFVDILWRW